MKRHTCLHRHVYKSFDDKCQTSGFHRTALSFSMLVYKVKCVFPLRLLSLAHANTNVLCNYGLSWANVYDAHQIILTIIIIQFRIKSMSVILSNNSIISPKLYIVRHICYVCSSPLTPRQLIICVSKLGARSTYCVCLYLRPRQHCGRGASVCLCVWRIRLNKRIWMSNDSHLLRHHPGLCILNVLHHLQCTDVLSEPALITDVLQPPRLRNRSVEAMINAFVASIQNVFIYMGKYSQSNVPLRNW